MPVLDDPSKPIIEAKAMANDAKWMPAARILWKHAELLNIATPKRCEYADLAGKYFFKAAFQSNSSEEFQGRMHLSRSAFELATSLFQEAGKKGQAHKSHAGGIFAKYWAEQNSASRRNTIQDCILSAREAKAEFEKTSDRRGTAETNLDLLVYLRENFLLAKSWESLKDSLTETLMIGRTAIREFEALGDDERLFESIFLTFWMLAVEAQPILPSQDFEALGDEGKTLAARLFTSSERKHVSRAELSLGLLAAGFASPVLYDNDLEKAITLFKRSVEASERDNDSLTKGLALWQTAYYTFWSGIGGNDPAVRRASLHQATQTAASSIQNLEISSPSSFLSVIYSLQADILMESAQVAVNSEEKRSILRNSIAQASKGAGREDFTWSWKLAAHALSKATYYLALTEERLDEKARLLNEALTIRRQIATTTERVAPALSWDKCVELNYLALIKRELALSEKESATRIELLRGAISDMSRCLEIGKDWAKESQYFTQNLARYSEWYGDTLFKLYQITGETGHAEKAARAYQNALDYIGTSKPDSGLGSIRWKIARAFDATGDFEESSREFSQAAKEYRTLAEKITVTSPTFENLAKYMDFWAMIEKARLSHSEEEYLLASEDYDKASKVLVDVASWEYLSRLSTARSMLEKGEAMSHLERRSASLESFSSAAECFRTAKQDLDQRLRQIPQREELEELRYWVAVADEREKYCRGRMLLEEAVDLDRQGDKKTSSRKYSAASEKFAELSSQTRVGGRDRIELETISKFCLALSLMKDGESKVSPEQYARAADLFMQVKEAAYGDKFRLLALANGYICKSLDAGTRFRLGRDQQLYAEVKTNLETAADYYQEAGFRKAAIWTRGYQRLFDSLFSLSSAETETEAVKKARQYDQAERSLEAAARLFGEAGFPAKKVEALEHLERTRAAKDILAASLQGLGEMPAASGEVLTPISLTGSHALGIERFEEANIVGSLSPSQRDPVVGADVRLDFGLTNIGRSPAILVRLENTVPAELRIDREKSGQHWENGSLDLGGRRLDYLKSCQLTIFLKASQAGIFELRPRVSFLDERGRLRSYEGLRENITVHETQPMKRRLTSSGPPPTITISSDFRFESDRSRRIFEYLVREFLNDYMTKKLYQEKAGWRSLMDIARELKMPRSVVYSPRGRGPALSELERRGLVETRIFPGERGRGGDITRMRVSYDNAIVRRLLDQLVMKDDA